MLLCFLNAGIIILNTLFGAFGYMLYGANTKGLVIDNIEGVFADIVKARPKPFASSGCSGCFWCPSALRVWSTSALFCPRACASVLCLIHPLPRSPKQAPRAPAHALRCVA